MAHPEHVEIVKRGADAIREWRKKNPDVRLDLNGANLSGANLCRANLREADLFSAKLIGTDLSEADLIGAILCGANLSDANLSGTDLQESDFGEANLCGADLRRVDICRTILNSADLRGSEFAEAKIIGAVLGDVDLSVAKGLETVRHDGPSTIGVDTLVRSQGRITDGFLRGCGFTQWQVLEAKLYDPALTAEEFVELQYKVFQQRNRGPLCIGGVFISYSRTDSKFVDKVYKRLSKEGVPTWLDRHDLDAGPLQKQISRAIRLNDVVLLVLSEASIKSDWVENELDMARRKEKEESRDALCPVALDDAWKAKVANVEGDDRALWRTLAHKNILDFSSWKTKAFDGQFDKLLRGMKIYYEPKKA